MTFARALHAVTLVTLTAIVACKPDSGPAKVVAPGVVNTGSVVFQIAAAPVGLEAIRLRVVGPGISNATAVGSASILLQQSVADTTTLFMTVRGTSGAFLRVAVDNVDHLPVAIMQEATAGRANGYAALPAAAVAIVSVRQ